VKPAASSSCYKSSPHVPILSQINPVHPPSYSWRFILILSSHLCLGFTSRLLPLDFTTKTFMRLSSHSHVLHAPPTWFFLLWSAPLYSLRSTDHYAIILFSLLFSVAQCYAAYSLWKVGINSFSFWPQYSIPEKFQGTKIFKNIDLLFFLVPLVVDILEFTLVKVILCLFSKNDSAYQTNNYDTDGSCGMDWRD